MRYYGKILIVLSLLMIVRWRMVQYELHPPVFLFDVIEKKNSCLGGAFGFASVLANRYWFVLLHYTQELLRSHNYDALYALACHITDLDPHANVVYRYGAQLLLLNAQRPDYAERLLKKSLQSPFNHDDWRIYMLLSFAKREQGDDQSAKRYSVIAAQVRPRDYAVLKMQRPAVPEWLIKAPEEAV